MREQPWLWRFGEDEAGVCGTSEVRCGGSDSERAALPRRGILGRGSDMRRGATVPPISLFAPRARPTPQKIEPNFEAS